MSLQRKSIYLPDLFIIEAYRDFFAMWEGDTYEFLQYHQDSELEKVEGDQKSKRGTLFQIPLHNAGFAGAKKVSLHWDIPADELYELLQSVNEEKELLIKKSSDRESKSISLSNESKSIYVSEYYHDEYTNRQIAIVPPSQDTTKKLISIPKCYINLVSFYVLLKHKCLYSNTNEFIHDELKEIPDLTLTLSYFDIGGNRHKKRFSIRFSIMGNLDVALKTPIYDRNLIGTYTLRAEEQTSRFSF